VQNYWIDIDFMKANTLLQYGGVLKIWEVGLRVKQDTVKTAHGRELQNEETSKFMQCQKHEADGTW
jgi:hypothetical protein